jgi:hypothetical protein
MPTIVHFEIPTDDVERPKKFYSELFGWSFEKLPKENTPEGCEIYLVKRIVNLLIMTVELYTYQASTSFSKFEINI